MSTPTPFNADLVTIERHRRSTTQGSVVVSYCGCELGNYADTIVMVEDGPTKGEYVGFGDSYWHRVAKREAIKKGIASDQDKVMCSLCNCTYDEGGDGFLGLCPSCSDKTGDEVGFETALSNRELNMILSALRLAQRKIGDGYDFSQCEIATNGFEDFPLTPNEIDGLCDRLNEG